MTQPAEKIQTFLETSPSYLKSDLLNCSLTGDKVAAVKSYLKDCHLKLFQKMDEKVPASRLVQLFSLWMDQLITGLYHRALEESQAHGVLQAPLALLAQGGYGRAELNLYSDIDLLFVYDHPSKKALEAVIHNMLYPLWDAKLKVGYATRTLEECSHAMQEDVRAMSSMLDARFLAGDRDLGQKFFQLIESKTASPRALKKFIRAKLEETEERLKKFGGSVYVVEPNLKESEGGLRDWHLLRYFARMATKSVQLEDWVRSGSLNNEEAEELRRALEFLWEVRNRLHRLAQKAQDQLSFSFQAPLAEEMGFVSDENKLAAEKFMQSYYGHAADLQRLRFEVTRKILKPPHSSWQRFKNTFRPSLSEFFLNVSGEIFPKSFRKIETHPEQIVQAFALAAKKKLTLEEGFKAWIRRHLNLVDQNYRCNPQVCALLREMFADVATIGDTLWEMHDCGLLGVLLPEFGEILHQTQHDFYHVYTVDTHSIKAVQELGRLKNGVYDEDFPQWKQALKEIQNPSVLVLGTLFHDIGKGKGGRHSEVGAELAETIMTRLGYATQEIEEVKFLVLSHLIMPHLSQRRDLEDVNLIHQFANTMESLERLNLLFILTWADIRAVGPEVWTPWKGSLLSELYEKTKQIFTTGDFTKERAVAIMEAKIAQVLKLRPKRFVEAELEKYLHIMPPRYFLAFSPEEILSHFEWIDGHEEPHFAFHHQARLPGKYNEVMLYTLNTPRLFEQVTGVMASHQINILGLEQFFTSQGEALLVLKVTDSHGELLTEERRFKNLEKELRQVLLEGRAISPQFRQTILYSKKPTHRAPRVEIDQDVSPYYTVIDIYTGDRVGLLYDLAKLMRRLGLFVEVSKITTKVDQVSDSFYVKDVFGGKIRERAKVKKIREEILAALE